ncbi:L-serine ammonia-lyase, iron-sulfur-dependent, subunit alpha, partial [Staphylococcus felis]
MFKSVKELIAKCESEDKAIHEVMLEQEMAVTGLSKEKVYEYMNRNFETMENAVHDGIQGVTSKT